ncbi:MAG: hypothetical protein ABFD54_05935 [Armatimonadota bacterium]|nr:hypothetical protein [bacterium]
MQGKLYYHKSLPTVVVIKIADGQMLMQNSLELRPIDIAKCKPYRAPQTEALIPVPEYLYRHYGIELS